MRVLISWLPTASQYYIHIINISTSQQLWCGQWAGIAQVWAGIAQKLSKCSPNYKSFELIAKKQPSLLFVTIINNSV